jgi:hypothetical protein
MFQDAFGVCKSAETKIAIRTGSKSRKIGSASRENIAKPQYETAMQKKPNVRKAPEMMELWRRAAAGSRNEER